MSYISYVTVNQDKQLLPYNQLAVAHTLLPSAFRIRMLLVHPSSVPRLLRYPNLNDNCATAFAESLVPVGCVYAHYSQKEPIFWQYLGKASPHTTAKWKRLAVWQVDY